MVWIPLHCDIWENIKTFRMVEILGISECAVVGHLIALWHFTLRNVPETGDLTPYGVHYIEQAAKWKDGEGRFVEAAQKVGFMDGLKIHAWDKHAEAYHASLEKADRNKEQSRKRVKDWRERKRNAKVTRNGNVTVTPGYAPIERKNKEDKEDKNNKYTAAFLEWWESYPKKVGRGAVVKIWDKQVRGKVELSKMLLILEKQKASDQWQKEGGQFIPNPTTYLNQGRWDDEVESPNIGGSNIIGSRPGEDLKKKYGGLVQ